MARMARICTITIETPKPTSAKRKRGNPSKPPGERGRGVNTYLPGPVCAWLESLGGGSASKGLRLVVTELHRREMEKAVGANEKTAPS